MNDRCTLAFKNYHFLKVICFMEIVDVSLTEQRLKTSYIQSKYISTGIPYMSMSGCLDATVINVIFYPREN